MGYSNQNKNDRRFDDTKFNKKWITDKIDMDCINFTEEFGTYLVKNGLTTSQIRNVFGEVRRIQAQGDFKKNEHGQQTDFLLLKPKIAYAAKRGGYRGIEDFKKVMDKAHAAVKVGTEEKVETLNKRFKNFCDFFEAILAYHKASGGRD